MGDGSRINALSFPWIDVDNDFFAHGQQILAPGPSRVADFIVQDTCCWNLEKLNLVFNSDEVKRITRTTIPPPGVEDKLVWHFSRDEKYTVKSAYKLAAQLLLILCLRRRVTGRVYGI